MMSRLFKHTGDRIALVAVVVMMALSLGATLMDRWAGLALMRSEFYILIPVLAVLVLIGWGMSAIFRRIKNQTLKKAVGALMVVLLLMLFVITSSYAMFTAGITMPQKYSVVISPKKGNRLVVMRGLDADETRIQARHEARMAADPEGNPEITADDWGYTYTAYAMDPLGALFYRRNTLLEGEVRIGYASKAELMVEWEDDESVGHFFVKNPEQEDGGEMRASTGR